VLNSTLQSAAAGPSRSSRQTLAVALGLAAVLLSPGLAAAARGGRLALSVVDPDTGEPIPCRMHLFQGAKRPRLVAGLPGWHDHFALPGHVTLDLPKGEYYFELERGPEYLRRTGRFTIDDFADDTKEVDLKRFVDMAAHGWFSGDLDVRRPRQQIELVMEADDLHVALLAEPNTKRPQTKPSNQPPADGPIVPFDTNRSYSTAASRWSWSGTTLLCAGSLPQGIGGAASGAAMPPGLVDALAALRRAGGWVDLASPTARDLPTLVALGQIDSIRIADGSLGRDRIAEASEQGRPRDVKLFPGKFGAVRWSQEIYFRLLDCGLRIPPSAGSASGEAPNPIGYNRMYVHVPGEFAMEAWWDALRAGRVTITNGPLLLPEVDGQRPGHVFRAKAGQVVELEIGLTLYTREPITYLEIIQDGEPAQSIPFAEYQESGRLPKVRFERSGWFLLRAVTELRDTYRFAMTGPYYVEIGGVGRVSRADAEFFLDWVYERAREVRDSLADSPEDRAAALTPHRLARDFWQKLVERANAE